MAHNAYHKHGAYILSHADMPGFSRKDQGFNPLLDQDFSSPSAPSIPMVCWWCTLTASSVDIVAFAQRIETVAFARMQCLGVLQGIDDTVAHGFHRYTIQASQFCIEKAKVEGSVVNNQLGAIDEFEEFISNCSELGLVGEKLKRDAAYVFWKSPNPLPCEFPSTGHGYVMVATHCCP